MFQLIALCCVVHHIHAASIMDVPSSNQQLQMRTKRTIIFRPLFVHRNQEARRLDERQQQFTQQQQQQPAYVPAFRSQPGQHSPASNGYDYSSQSAYYSPYDSNYYWPYYSAPSAGNYFASQTAARPAADQFYYPRTTARPVRSTTKKFRPFPVWG